MTQTSIVSDDIHPRRPLVAALLSLALPGLGQLYDGEINKALWLFFGFVLIGIPGVVIAALYVPSSLMLPLLVVSALLTLAVWFGAIIDAWREAERRQIFLCREWQVSGVYALLLLTGYLSVFTLFGAMRQRLVQTFEIPAASMELRHSPRRFPVCRQALQLPRLQIARCDWRYRHLRLSERPHALLHQARHRPAGRSRHD